jgi:hypothetical protein
MNMPDVNVEIEEYSSYKGRTMTRYKDKARNLYNAIDSLSLKPKDKEKLKNYISDKFKTS